MALSNQHVSFHASRGQNSKIMVGIALCFLQRLWGEKFSCLVLLGVAGTLYLSFLASEYITPIYASIFVWTSPCVFVTEFSSSYKDMSR